MAVTEPGQGTGSSPAGASRYPGVHPFGDDALQRQLFRGRDAEKYELLQLVLAERLTLLFARSGIGKSSLINAGLLEPLREKGYFPMVVRVSGSAGSPVQCLYEGVKAAADAAAGDGHIDFEPPEADWNRTSLWHFFKTFELWQGDSLLAPVLVIDQFEELFTLHTADQRKQFIHELADLVRGTRPREAIDPSGAKLSEAPPDVKVVLSLREDFYANLEELRDRIPSIYKAPFRLQPLSREQAEHAMVEPAALVGDGFRTPAFSWSEEALGTILDFLSEQQLGEGRTQVGRDVEPFQLQLVCQRVEEMVAAGGLERISLVDIGGADALKAVLSSFYEDTLRNICGRFPEEKDLRGKLEQLCEYGFITAKGRRLLREESTIKQDDDVGPEVLRELVELRLLRKEPRVGDNYYELTHDTLIEPIQISRQAREEREAREARAAHARARRKFAAAGALATVVLLAMGSWALWEQRERRRVAEAKQAAVEAQQQAEQAKNDARIAQRDAEKETERAVAAREQALVDQQESAKVALKATLQAGEEGARRRVAEAEARLAEITPMIDAAQKTLAEATVQAAEAKGEDYEQDAQRLVSEAEGELAKLNRQLDVARADVFEAKKGVALAETTTEVVKASVDAASVEQGAIAPAAGAVPRSGQNPSGADGQAVGGEVEIAAIETQDVLAEGERQAEVLVAQLEVESSGGTDAVAQSGQTVASADAAEKTGQKARAKVNLAALELRETEPEITDAELTESYREFLSQDGSDIGAEEVRRIEGKIEELEQAAAKYAELKAKDESPDFSLCEAFDQWAAFQPRRSLGPEARHRDLRLAELNALIPESAVVTMQMNFITSLGENDMRLRERFRVRQDKVYMHAWINAPGTESVRLEVRHGENARTIWKGKRVTKNPLRGEQMGYHLWTWKGATAPGTHELRLYNARDRLICRREYEVVAATP